MRKIFCNEKNNQQYWDNLWSKVGFDPEDADILAYPLYPTINYITDKDGLILECGCGPGRVVNYFHNHGFNIIGMDYSNLAIKSIKSKKPEAKVLCADALQLPFSDKSFKYICNFGVYSTSEQVSQRKQILSESYRVLENKGIFIFSYASYNSIYYWLYSLRQNSLVRKIFFKKSLQRHFAWYQLRNKEVVLELKAAGFVVEGITYVKARQFFYDTFPFFRTKVENFDRKDTVRLERMGDNIYPLSQFGKKVFTAINKIFPQLLSTSIVAIAYKK